MKLFASSTLRFLAALSVATLVAACGGGGGAPNVGTTPAPSAPLPATQTGAKGEMYDYINQFRMNGGFGALAADGRLEAAAQAHADYLMTHFYKNGVPDPILFTLNSAGIPHAHFEESTRAGFTGAVPNDRLRAAGYQPMTSLEVSASQFGASVGAEPSMKACVDTFMNTVFHRAGLLDTATDNIGIGIGAAVRDSNGFVLRNCVLNLASQSAPRTLPAQWIGVVPYASQTGVATKMLTEVPDPAPTIAIEGYPVSLQIPSAYTLNVESFTLAESNGQQVSVVIVTRVQSILLRANEAYLVPNGALRANTTYTATFSGTAAPTVAGQTAWSVNKTWSFTTGAQ